jgi:hypothetical protein
MFMFTNTYLVYKQKSETKEKEREREREVEKARLPFVFGHAEISRLAHAVRVRFH